MVKILTVLVLVISMNAQAQVRSADARHFTADFDYLWSHLEHNYAYFGKKRTDWKKVRSIYRPQVSRINQMSDFVSLLEKVLDELYDPHTHLRTNTVHSTRLIPTGLDVWAEWRNGRPIITQLRPGFSAEQSGLRVGMEIVSVDGNPINKAVDARRGSCITAVDQNVRNWSLLVLLAGRRDKKRVLEAKDSNGLKATYRLDQAHHRTVDNYNVERRVNSQILQGGFGYISINDLGSDQTVTDFDAALNGMTNVKGLILDLRATQSGGNSSVAEPIMERFITKKMAYQKGRPRHGRSWTKYVCPEAPGLSVLRW